MVVRVPRLATARATSTGSVFTVDGGLDAQQMALRPVTEAERIREAER